jgi:iron complex transport system ATP-binding protein
MTTIALETRALTLGYRRRRRSDVVLAHSLNLGLQKGQLVGLLGPNGVGKSTLLRTLARMQTALGGRILINGQDLATLSPAALARCLSIVLTVAPAPNMMNGYSLVALGRHPHSDWLGRLTAEDHEAVAWAIAAVNAEDLAETPLAELSDGQRQKLMIARALAQESAIMLLDEPTAYLDLPRRVETMQLLKRLARQAERAILVSTHDLDLALRNCDQLWLMQQDNMAIGAPEDLVLQGRLGETFSAAGINFDERLGAFVLDSPPGKRVKVCGDSTEAMWMRRALARSGYQLCEEAVAIEVARRTNGGAPLWHLRVHGRASAHRTVQAVLEALEGERA